MPELSFEGDAETTLEVRHGEVLDRGIFRLIGKQRLRRLFLFVLRRMQVDAS